MLQGDRNILSHQAWLLGQDKKKEIAIKEVTRTTCKIQRRTYDCYFLLILVIMLR